MAIVKILGNYKNKKNKNNFDKFVVKKIGEDFDKEFNDELFIEKILIEKTIAKNESKIAIQQRIKKLENIKKKYFSLSDSLENKITLLSYLAKLSDKYNSQLIDYVENNLAEIMEKYKLNWVISKLNDIRRYDEEIIKYMVYLKNLKIQIIENNSVGGVIPSYRDIQDSSISIGGEYNFQKA
ncbi:hypothetical protein [Clostridium perfringens]|uniref:hypothetical protein n=1 Tax=Clostridium perfringens TaxID=1502 RepID=UPI0023400A52|nr:hypothetical protein [Clostridium perfringens]MDC4245580.1 hypothetical protein [Clostridium perfringens]